MSTTTKTLTLEQLAEKLNGKLWTKGDLKRIYLDEGYNTKKMSTKTFVWQNENGEFKVSCKVECPSQPWEWCKSQEDEVKESVNKEIENILTIAELELIEVKTLEEGKNFGDIMVYVKRGNNEPSWFTEEIFYDQFGSYPQDVWEAAGKAKLYPTSESHD